MKISGKIKILMMCKGQNMGKVTTKKKKKYLPDTYSDIRILSALSDKY